MRAPFSAFSLFSPQELWSEVLGLLVEDKEALPAGTVIQKAKINHGAAYRRSSSTGGCYTLNLFNLHLQHGATYRRSSSTGGVEAEVLQECKISCRFNV